jgi:hypothetical protein
MGAEKSNAYSSVNGIEDIAKKALTEVSVIAITRVIINFGKTGLNDVMSEKKKEGLQALMVLPLMRP